MRCMTCLTLFLLLSACHGDEPAPIEDEFACRPGTDRACTCADGGESVQTCLEGGDWGPCRGCRLPPIDWRVSLEMGSEDPRGQRISATEVRSLVVYQDRLFAGAGIWMEPDTADPLQPGPMVLVLDRPVSQGGRWLADLVLTERIEAPGHKLDGSHRFFNISAMKAVEFTTDASGNALEAPVPLLVFSVWDHWDATEVFVRDASGNWNRTTVIPPSDPPDLSGTCRRHIRSFVLHRDGATGVDMLFAGTNGKACCESRIYAGVYDVSVPGRIRWHESPEPFEDPPNPDDRVLSMAEANSKLYATVCGKLYERQDGDTPTWKLVFKHKDDFCPAGPGESGYRGTTAIPGDTGEILMMAMEGWSPHVGRIDPLADFAFVQELDTRKYLRDEWSTLVTYVIAAYNDITPFRMTDGNTVLLLGLEASTPLALGTWNSWAPGAWYFVRYNDADYELRQIQDFTLPNTPKLVATRTLVASPFNGEQGRVIYAGGFDANRETCHDTGWLYRGELQTR